MSAETTGDRSLQQKEIATMNACAQSSTPPLTSTVLLEIPAELSHVQILSRCVVAHMEQFVRPEEAEVLLYNLELAIQEIAVNIVTHAYADTSGRVSMRSDYDVQAGRLFIVLEDTGKSFDPAQVQEPALGTLQEHGYGLFLASSLLDELHYYTDSTGNRWELTKYL
jgi:anti-sigma regulatory factor (Ser/Thr protein kinase)